MISFRQTLPTDTPALEEICAAVSLPSAILTQNAPSQSGWVACENDHPIAFAMASNDGQLLALAVTTSHRGKHLASELMRQAELWLFSHGHAKITLTLPQENKLAATFFTHHGWQPTENNSSDLEKQNPGPLYKLEEHTISDPTTGYTRLLRLQRGPADSPHTLCLFLDGEHYWRDMNAVPLLANLVSTGTIPPATFAFLGHVSALARHQDYTCNENYTRYVGETVMPWLQNQLPTLKPNGHLIAGLSLSGLTAVHLALKYPQHFATCLSQSGAHWYNHKTFPELAKHHAPIKTKFWLSVGTQETATNLTHPPTSLHQDISQIEGVQKTTQTLKQLGAQVHLHQHPGTHSLRPWREELPDALIWLLNP